MKTEGKSNVRKIKVEKGRPNRISRAKIRKHQSATKSKPKTIENLSNGKSSALNKVKKPSRNVRVSTRNAASAGKANLMKKIHLEYLTITQRYYAEQYENLSKKFYAKFGQQGEKAKTVQQKSTFDNFQAERNKLFQGGQYKHVHSLIDRIDDGRRDELYALTDKYQQEMKRTLRNLESMLFSVQ